MLIGGLYLPFTVSLPILNTISSSCIHTSQDMGFNKEEYDTSIINQPCDQLVAKADKHELIQLLDTVWSHLKEKLRE